MKKVFGKLIPFCVLAGALAAEITLYYLLRILTSPLLSLTVCFLCALPFPVYGAARVLKPGKLRRLCNLAGGILLTPLCYFMIVTTAIGCVLFLRECMGYPAASPALCRHLLILDTALVFAVVVTGMLNSLRIKKIRYTVCLPGVSDCRIVFFSDLHLGDLCSVRRVAKISNMIKEESPDLVLFGGDLVDMDFPHSPKAKKYADSLATLGGIIGCEGNHDLHDLKAEMRNKFLENANIRILQDSTVTDPKTGIRITGRNSERRERMTVEKLIAGGCHILLEHNPKKASEALDAGVPLVLCGHTHKGQTFPGNILRRLSNRYFYGKHETDRGTVITTAGCGSTGLPLRFGVTAEIVILQLKSYK